MMLSFKKREELARDSFELASLIDGGTTGGLFPPRIFLEIKAIHKPTQSIIGIRWKYPPEVHPCSDVTYHFEHPQSVYCDVYRIGLNGICLLDGNEPFSVEYLDFIEYQQMVSELYKKYGIKEKRQLKWRHKYNPLVEYQKTYPMFE